MNLAINDHRLTKPGPQDAALRDYDSVRRAIAFISEHWRAQPTIEAMADAAAVTPDELHLLFRRWAGLTPKAFMQALTLDHAKGLLRDSASVLDAALDSGLSGPGRLHDLFVTHEAMSPGEWKNGGAGMTLRYGFHPSPFGTAIVIASGRGLAGLAFADPGGEPASFADMKRRWPNATYVEDHEGTAPLAQRIFDTKLWRPDQPLRVVLIGTDFEVRVWETLLKIPMGRAVCYSDIASYDQQSEGLTRGRCCGRAESGIVRGALPSRARQRRRVDRLSLGYHPQAGDARLGSGTGGIAVAGTSCACAQGARYRRRHTPPPGLAFGEPDDRLQRSIQSSPPSMKYTALEYWIIRPSRMMTAEALTLPDRASTPRWRRR